MSWFLRVWCTLILRSRQHDLDMYFKIFKTKLKFGVWKIKDSCYVAMSDVEVTVQNVPSFVFELSYA
jgi:hypothetical protein